MGAGGLRWGEICSDAYVYVSCAITSRHAGRCVERSRDSTGLVGVVGSCTKTCTTTTDDRDRAPLTAATTLS